MTGLSNLATRYTTMGNYVQAVPLYQEALQQEIQAIESKLATSFATAGQTRRALGVTTEQIVATLPSDTISISWLRSRRLNMSLLDEIFWNRLSLPPVGTASSWLTPTSRTLSSFGLVLCNLIPLRGAARKCED